MAREHDDAVYIVEETDNCQKFETGRIPCVLNVEHHLALHNTLTLVVSKMWVLKAYLAIFTHTGMILGPSWQWTQMLLTLVKLLSFCLE